MISYIKGNLVYTSDEAITVECGGFGINIRVPSSVLQGLPPIGEEVLIFTYMYVREDLINLFGFLSNDDLNIFKLLLNVSGIGPKGALSVLSVMTPDELRLAILTSDTGKISSAPGIGKKSAERLVLELKDKVGAVTLSGGDDSISNADVQGTDLTGSEEALEALESLGISRSDAVRAIKKCAVTKDMDTQQILKLALKNL